jgi:hypothetical protein
MDQECSNICHCLTYIKYNESIFNKLLDNHDQWKEVLIDSKDVQECFKNIYKSVKAKQNISRDKVNQFKEMLPKECWDKEEQGSVEKPQR